MLLDVNINPIKYEKERRKIAMHKKLQSIFSARKYMISRDYEIFYYNDSHFSGVNDHTHDYYEFYFLIDGNVSISIEGKTHELSANDMIIIPPNILHHVHNYDKNIPYQRFVFWISKDYHQKIKEISEDYTYITDLVKNKKKYIFHINKISFNALIAKMIRLLEESHSSRFGKNTMFDLCIKDLILSINRTIHEADNAKLYKENNDLYNNILQYIESNLDTELSLDKLADAFFMSKYHISHLFKNNLGISIHKYIIKKRLEMCKNSLLKNESISKLYKEFGFRDYTSFFRAFKKEFGLSPKEYKEKYKK